MHGAGRAGTPTGITSQLVEYDYIDCSFFISMVSHPFCGGEFANKLIIDMRFVAM